jgi:hypothetical protein
MEHLSSNERGLVIIRSGPLSSKCPSLFPFGFVWHMDASKVFDLVGKASYIALAAVALWGAYYVVLVLSRVGRKRFKTEEAQDAFSGFDRSRPEKGRF